MKTIHDPGIIALQFKQAHPCPVGFHSHGFFFAKKIDQSSAPREIRKTTPLSRNDR
jgi:hypothetical protein